MLDEAKYYSVRGVLGMGLYLLGLLGGWSKLLETMFIFIVIDYASGVIKGFYLKEVSSKIATRGIVKKVGYLLAVMIGVTFDEVIRELGMPTNVLTIFNIQLTARDLVILSIIGTEGISIVENLGAMGILIPKPIQKMFKQLRNNDK